MALKAIMLRKKIDAKRREAEALRAKLDGMAERESTLEQAIAEAETAEEDAAVDAEIEAFEAEKTKAKAEAEAADAEVKRMEEELASIEEEDRQRAAAVPATPENRAAEKKQEERAMDIMNTATSKRAFYGMNPMEQAAFFARDDVKNYLNEVRTCIKEKRALTNVGLTIPEVFLGVLKENISNFSKLYKHVNVRRLSGNGRLVVMGSVPEGIWTDCCANLNELDLVFNDTEINCWKVGGFFAVCNAVIEDSDVDLAAELTNALGQSIGKALDKAILYGTGSRMPLGIVTRLAQTSEPADYQATERDWVDLHTTNIVTIGTSYTGVGLFEQIVLAAGAAKGDYSSDGRTWAMNEKTKMTLIAEAMSINSAGAIVSGMGNTMPVLGGTIETINFIPDNVIIGGYFDLYLLGERAGEKFATSEHVKFLNDQTVFKGTARYDGKPVIAEGFVVIGIANTSPSASMTFAPDEANSVRALTLNVHQTSLAAGLTLDLIPTLFPDNVKGTVTWASSDATKAEVSSGGRVTAKAQGSATITATCGSANDTCAVTVTAGA